MTTRVTRRSENDTPPDRLDTSEYFQQVLAHLCLLGAPATSTGISLVMAMQRFRAFWWSGTEGFMPVQAC